MSSLLLESTELAGICLKNRFVRSAIWDGLADERGYSTPLLTKYMTDLAQGGVGLIITGHAYVLPEGQAHHHQIAIYDDSYIPALTALTSSVHKNGGKIVLQIAHAGFRADHNLSGMVALAPSVVDENGVPICKEMTIKEIKRTIGAFGDAARRAKEAGFDGVQIHGGHGYLVNQFLAPYFNRRHDEYGGDLINRMRFLLDITKSIRNKAGDEYPVMLKINSEDFFERGFSLDEMLEVSRILEKEGAVDAIEMSGGNSYRGIGKYSPVRTYGMKEKNRDDVWYRASAQKYKEKISIPLILVGGIRSLEVAEELFRSDTADYISMARPFICEPDIVNRWKSGNIERAECISCSLCFINLLDGKGLGCPLHQLPKGC